MQGAGSVVPLGLAMMVGGMAARFSAHLLQLSMSRSAEYDADMVADATGVCNWDFMSVDEIASSMYGYAAATDGIFQSSNAYGNPSINGPSCL